MEIFDAIKSGDLEKVKEIVTHNPSEINATDENGISAVLTAAYYRQTSILDELLSRGPSINIFEAVVIGDMENLKRWLAKDQSLIGIHSKDGFSLLGLASYFSHYSIAEHLISLGANINDVSQNDFMVAPLHSAVSSQDFDITRLLLVNGANPNLAQTKGIRPIHQAAHAGNKSMLELLLKHGADPNLVTDEGKNAIDFAKEVNADEIIRILTSR